MFVTRPIAEAALRRLANDARVDMWDDEMPPPHDHLLAQLKHCDGVLSMVSDRFDAATIAAAPRLAVISNLAVGVDNVDLAAATRAGIPVGHTPGVLTETTADLAFALLMASARRVAEGDRFVRAHRWRAWTPRLMLGRDVWGATLGIIGWGAIGQAMARRGAAFGMRVLYVSHDHRSPDSKRMAKRRPATDANGQSIAAPNAERADLERLLAESDFVSLHVPLTPETRHLIG
ncbi:MAG TPA: NAD(P)-dependent oxidoreductase, partial [Candidatus Binataceae bacterium]|nr:NAD(P)-dependent oxidoreductase [Candidatus Binataceae bacterium]